MRSSIGDRAARLLGVAGMASLAVYVVYRNLNRPPPPIEPRPTIPKSTQKIEPDPIPKPVVPIPEVQPQPQLPTRNEPAPQNEPEEERDIPWPFHLNTASREDLLLIPVLTPVLVDRIIQARTKKGYLPYSQLQPVLGFTDKEMRELGSYLRP